jgi:dextranase
VQIKDFYPLAGCFHPGERVRLAMEIEAGPAPGPLDIQLAISHLYATVDTLHLTCELPSSGDPVVLCWQPPLEAPAGYGAALFVSGQAGEARAKTAFDVLDRWTDYPRYGFVCDFSPDRVDTGQALDSLARFHINGLQFYDWQYRHDSLLPPEDEYLDPLGRPLSLHTVRSLIAAAHARNMAAMPYLAVYAASPDFWRAHPEWALYDANGRPLDFMEGFLGFMDPTAGGGWCEHLLAEAGRVLAALPFDGLHVDQYGEPRQAWDAGGRPVDLPGAFADFLRAAQARFPQRGLVFNAVANWPIEALAKAPADFEYIEIWPPQTGYADLAAIVDNARRLSGGRPVAIALYLPSGRPANNLLADAIIFASGGGRIELGEGARLLSDPYFPLHQEIAPPLMAGLRRFYDFAVRYGAWTGPGAFAAEEIAPETPAGVWAFPRRAGSHVVIHLVNFSSLGESPRWDDDHGFPQPHINHPITVELPQRPRRVWWASPEHPDLHGLSFDYSKHHLSARLPALIVWAILVVET